jgi:hypothetical protein
MPMVISRTLAVLLACAAVPAAAQAPRYVLQPVDGGFLRLDSDTGRVSHCRKEGEQFACRAVADDIRALEDEMQRLKAENEALRAGRPPETGNAQGRLTLPTEQEVDQALSMMERMMRRMLNVFREEAKPGAPL